MTPKGGNELLNAEEILKNQLGLEPGQRVADLGSGGVGMFSIEAAKLVTDTGQVHAVDILKSVLANIESRAKMENLHNIKTHWTNLERFGALKINDQTLDVAMLINTLFQNKDHESILREATRLLKKDGKLLVVEWIPGRSAIGPNPADKIDPERIREIAQSIGLVEVSSFSAGQYHYGIIFKRP